MNVLEVGANQGEHLRYVVKDFSLYTMSDIRNVELSISDARVKFQQANLESLPFGDSIFDRVICTCVFHHVTNPERGFEEIRRVLKDGGTFSLMLPNDPGLAYRTFRRLTSLIKAQKLGILSEARLAHSREHRNHYLSLKVILEWVFRTDQINYRHFPFHSSIYDLNLLTVCTITINKSDINVSS
jgi:ubiquinone/menaquinone biosynthesis C-methylase UbiE